MQPTLFLATATFILLSSAAPAPSPQYCSDRPPPCYAPTAITNPTTPPPLALLTPSSGNWSPAIPPGGTSPTPLTAPVPVPVPVPAPAPQPKSAPKPKAPYDFGSGTSAPKSPASAAAAKEPPSKDKPYITKGPDGFTMHGPLGTYHKGPDGTLLKGGLGEYSNSKGAGTEVHGSLGTVQWGSPQRPPKSVFEKIRQRKKL